MIRAWNAARRRRFSANPPEHGMNQGKNKAGRPVRTACRVRALLRANPDTPETGLAPTFQQLVENLLPLLPGVPHLIVAPEYRNPGIGRPDIALIRQGQPPRAFVELKAPSKHADPRRWRDPDRSEESGGGRESGRWC
jgi:hypothetical protein